MTTPLVTTAVQSTLALRVIREMLADLMQSGPCDPRVTGAWRIADAALAAPSTPRNYGCMRCQKRHYSGEPLFDAHLAHQSKHGFAHSAEYEAYRPADLREVAR